MKILLHACCGPCATSSIKRLLKDHNVTVYYYNPNIHPKDEYLKRLDNAKKVAKILNVPIIEADYNPEIFLEITKGLEHEPEGGKRCEKCYELRIRKTMEYAKQHRFEAVTTTITISPHHKSDIINAIGQKLERELNVKYLPENFKKKDGFLESIKMSKEMNLYRQNYCGCIYSK